MDNKELILSNSMLHDWESMCKFAWKRRWIDGLRPEASEAMEFGNYFETLVIGSSVGGKVFQFTDSPEHQKMKKSEYRCRVESQALTCSKYLKLMGGKIAATQTRIATTFTDSTGYTFKVDGGLDIEYRLPDGQMTVIDLKMGDGDNDFGKYAWGAPHKMDLSQIVHYGFLMQEKYGYYPETMYYMIFDRKPVMRSKIIPVQVSDQTKYYHVERCAQVHKEISLAIEFDDWGIVNNYDNCSTCFTPCDHQRILPDMDLIII